VTRFGHAADRALALAEAMDPVDKGVVFDHTGSIFIATFVPPDVVKQLVELGIYDPDADTAVEDPLHITLLFLGKDSTVHAALPDIVQLTKLVVSGAEPMRATVAGFGRFNAGEDGVPYFALISCRGLSVLQADLFSAVSSVVDPPSEHGFIPHMTLGYALANVEVVLPTLKDVEVGWDVSEICLCVGGEARQTFTLGR
jgi:2'-5' RNA ligase